jgi:hypothetical protein
MKGPALNLRAGSFHVTYLASLYGSPSARDVCDPPLPLHQPQRDVHVIHRLVLRAGVPDPVHDHAGFLARHGRVRVMIPSSTLPCSKTLAMTSATLVASNRFRTYTLSPTPRPTDAKANRFPDRTVETTARQPRGHEGAPAYSKPGSTSILADHTTHRLFSQHRGCPKNVERFTAETAEKSESGLIPFPYSAFLR